MRVDSRLVNRIVLYGLLGLTVILFQTTLAYRIELFGVKPSLLISATIAVAMFEGYMSGTVFGGIVGFVCDATAGRYVGVTALLLMALGFTVGYLCAVLVRRNLLSALLIYVVASAATNLCILSVYLLIYGNPHGALLQLIVLAKEFAYSSVFVTPVYLLVHLMNRRLTVLE